MRNKTQRILATILATIMILSIPVISTAHELQNDYNISPMSLLPIEEVYAYVDLTEFSLDQLIHMTTYEMLSHLRDENTHELIEIDSAACTSVWANFFNDEREYLYDTWKVLQFNDTINIIDLYHVDENDVEVIVGSGNQFDPENTRYFIDFRMPGNSGRLDLRSYVYDELYNFRVSEIVKNIPQLQTNNMSTVEILWYVEDLVKSGYKFNYDITDGWLKLDYDASVKFAPTLQEKYSCDWWDNALTMIVKTDETTTYYVLDTIYPEYIDMFDINFYTQAEKTGKRYEIYPEDIYGYEAKRAIDGKYVYYYEMYAQIDADYSYDSEYYLGINLTENFQHCELNVIKGWEHNEDEIRNWLQNNQIPEEFDITQELVVSDMSQKDAGIKDYWLKNYSLDVMLCIRVNNDTYIVPVSLGIFRMHDFVEVDGLYADIDGHRIPIYDLSYDHIEEQINDEWYYTDVITYYAEKGYNSADEYYLGMIYYDSEIRDLNPSKVIKAVVGHYYTLDEAASKSDIKAQLFTDNLSEIGSGYKADFSGNGVDFTIFTEDDIWYYRIKTEETDYNNEDEPEYDEAPQIGSSDSIFNVTNLCVGNNTLDTYRIPYQYDTYYSYGYQTLLINDSDVDMTSVSPYITLADQSKVYFGNVLENTNSSYYHKLSPRDFTQPPMDVTKDPYSSVRYTVSTQNHANQKNYWVTAVKKEEGPKLFVNGPDEREIFFNNYFGNVHDIFIANVGSEELTGITATIDAKNVKLDEYWTAGSAGNNTLAPFTTTFIDSNIDHGGLFNIARIRLIPDGEGEIEGTLTITADGQEPRVITLSGTAGNPKIDTVTLRDAVKYVPYSTLITTNNMHDWNNVTFSISEGSLPNGLTLYSNGEIYGAPKETGEFPITIKSQYSHPEFESSYANLVLKVKDNTDENVDATVDVGYEITTRLPEKITKATNIDFVIAADFEKFVDLWLNGDKLTRDIDYAARSGSTKITLFAQTINKLSDGKITASVVFVDEDGVMRTSSHNSTIDRSGSNTTSNSGGGGGSSKCVITFETNGGNTVSKQDVKKGTKISDLPTPVKDGYIFAGWFKDKGLTQPFVLTDKINANMKLYAKWEVALPAFTFTDVSEFADVSTTDWFYKEVQWAYSNKLMVGYDSTQFAPSAAITPSMVVTVLSRIANVDVNGYANKQYSGVDSGQWYTPYANWAKATGIAEDISFNSSEEISREMMAIVIMNFFKYLNKNFSAAGEHVQFSDAHLISSKAVNAIQTLYKLGIFKGYGNNTINPLGNTTRAEFSVLIHRIHTLLNTYSLFDKLTNN